MSKYSPWLIVWLKKLISIKILTQDSTKLLIFKDENFNLISLLIYQGRVVALVFPLILHMLLTMLSLKYTVRVLEFAIMLSYYQMGLSITTYLKLGSEEHYVSLMLITLEDLVNQHQSQQNIIPSMIKIMKALVISHKIEQETCFMVCVQHITSQELLI